MAESSQTAAQVSCDEVPALIFAAGPMGICRLWNREFLNFCGGTIPEPWTELVHPEDKPRLLETLAEKAHRGLPFTIALQLRRADGQYRRYILAGRPLNGNGGPDYVVAALDVHSMICQAQKELAELRALLPICARCKRIRDDHGYWQSVEAYVAEHYAADFTHSLCPSCRKKLYPEMEQAQLALQANSSPAGAAKPEAATASAASLKLAALVAAAAR